MNYMVRAVIWVSITSMEIGARGPGTQTGAALTLEKFLAGLGVEDLRRIEALMYSGRGDGSASDLRQQLAENRSSKEDVVRTIMEKRASFDPYFDRGLDRAKADGIDLDTF